MDDAATQVEAPDGTEVAIGGTVQPGFEGVRDAFTANFTDHGEVGAGFSLVVDGRTVVDLWGGVADAATGAPYTEDTLQLVFSSTKGATALCANLLAQRGELDFDAPVATYWPEFAQGGKGDVPVRWLLCHRAGLAYIDTPVELADLLAWDPAVEALAAMTPLWEPGTSHGYHAVTYGWLVGEVVRRITGKSLGTFFADEVAGPLGLEFWIGLPDEQQARVAPLTNRGLRRNGTPAEAAAAAASEPGMAAENPVVEPEESSGDLVAMIEKLLGPDSMLARALGGAVSMPFVGEGAFNRPDVRAAELPAANGVTNARGLARMYAGTIGALDGVSSRSAADPRAGGRGLDDADQRRRPVPVLRDDVRHGVHDGVAVLALRQRPLVRACRRRRIGRVRRPRERARLRLRDEPHAGQPVGRPPQPGPRPRRVRRHRCDPDVLLSASGGSP